MPGIIIIIVIFLYVMLDPLDNVNLHIGDISYLADPHASFSICEGLGYLPSAPPTFHQISPVVEGPWVPEVPIYS